METIKTNNGNYTIKDLTEKEYKVLCHIINKTHECTEFEEENGFYETNDNLLLSFDKYYYAALTNLKILL